MDLRRRHDAARLLNELSRPMSALLIAHLPARPGATCTAADLQQATSLSNKDFWPTMGRLAELGLVQQTTDGLSVDRATLDRVTSSLVSDSPLIAILERHPRLEPFCRWGRVVRNPVEPDLAEEMYVALGELFDTGEVLDESGVNARIFLVHDDPAEVRRGLVDRGMLHRDPGAAVYRRT